MGWYEQRATCYTKKGNIDRKAEMRKKYGECVVKDALVGSTWYAACKLQNGGVGIEICLTSTRDGRYFSYKPMSASMGPYKYDCPESILALNTEHDGFTDSWISKCREKAKKKKELKHLERHAQMLRITMPYDTKYYREGDVVHLRRHDFFNGKTRWETNLCYFGGSILADLYERGCIEMIK